MALNKTVRLARTDIDSNLGDCSRFGSNLNPNCVQFMQRNALIEGLQTVQFELGAFESTFLLWTELEWTALADQLIMNGTFDH